MYRFKNKDYRFFIGIGQFSLVLGIFFSRVLGSGRIFSLVTLSELPEIWVYIFNTAAGLFLGLSLVFNFRGLMLYRRTKHANP